MARPARPERSRSARSSRQLSRFYHSINPDRVFGTHSEKLVNTAKAHRQTARFEHRGSSLCFRVWDQDDLPAILDLSVETGCLVCDLPNIRVRERMTNDDKHGAPKVALEPIIQLFPICRRQVVVAIGDDKARPMTVRL